MDENENGNAYDYTSPEAVSARAAVGRAISEYMNVIRRDETPYVVAWAVAVEWTNPELEQTQRAGRDILAPEDQTISATCGLGSYLHQRFI